MERYKDGDRRKADRRQANRRRQKTRGTENIYAERRRAERRQGNRRHHQRRQALRIAYPPKAAPKVLNVNVRIANMSSRGIMFTRHAQLDESTPPIMPGGIIDLKLQFHDEEVLEIEVKILRCRYDPESREEVFAGTMAEVIPDERIRKEQAYLSMFFPKLREAPSA